MKVLCKESTESIIKEKTYDSDINDDGKNIFCVYCNNLITKQNSQIKINESFKHVFANPHGIVFEIGCFNQAIGCSIFNESSYEFSWFPGYNWRIAVCNSCFNHLGWLFVSDANSFFGLILEKLNYN